MEFINRLFALNTVVACPSLPPLQALNDKMQQFTDNAMKFTMDGGIENVYDFKEEEEEVSRRGMAGRLVGR